LKKEDNIEFSMAKTYEFKLTFLGDKMSKLELELQDKDIDIEDLKTRIDVMTINNKQDREALKAKISQSKIECKELRDKVDHLEKEASKLRSEYISPKEFSYTTNEVNVKNEEILKLKMEVNRQKDTINAAKGEKLELMRTIASLEQQGKDFSKAIEELSKMKSELARKDKSITNLRMANEELKTEKELRIEGIRGFEDKMKQLKLDVERKDKLI